MVTAEATAGATVDMEATEATEAMAVTVGLTVAITAVRMVVMAITDLSTVVSTKLNRCINVASRFFL